MRTRTGWIAGGCVLLAAIACNSITGLDKDYQEVDCPFADSCSDAANDATTTGGGDGQVVTGDSGDGGNATGDGPSATTPDADAGPLPEAGGCAAGSLACDGGCVPNDPHNCGACGHDCTTLPNVNGAVACGTDGTCVFDAGACAPGFAPCGDAGPDRGCETSISMPNNCGACGTTCGATTPYCSGTGSSYMCTSGCMGMTPTLCNKTCVDTTSDPMNCNTCGNVCSTQDPHATVACVNSMCTSACKQGTRMCPSGLCAANDTSACGPNCTPCSGPTGGSVTCDGTKCNPSCPGGSHICNGACLSDSDGPSNDPCVISEAYGVFVAPTGNDSSGDGSRMHPYATIGHAIGAAGGKRVYACGGNYAESLTVGSSIAVYGGLNCSTWGYDGSKATVAPTAPGYALKIASSGVTFEDFAFASQPGGSAGDSSIAVFVNNASNVVLRRCQVNAGTGQPGADRTQTASFIGPAPGGIAAGSEGLAGPAQPNPACSSVGGAGGTIQGSHYSGSDGTRSTPYSPNGAVCGSMACTNAAVGGVGANGSPGSTGTGAQVWATFTSSGWTPAGGQSGGAGEDGQGGGGGGYETLPHNIIYGGGGGAGGCGGQPGAGGGGGGSSIAILVYNSALDVESCTLLASNAGRGGNGAAGEAGQLGGAQGGPAGSNYGGTGGAGGPGGAGGGGAGGVSAGVVWWGMPPTINGGSQSAGAQGAAGAGGGSSNGGRAGAAGAVIQFQ